MSHTIRVSRHNLGVCPACQHHIHLKPDAAEAACPFCGTTLAVVSEAKGGLMRGALAAGRGGVLAVSLLVGGCTEEVETPVYGIAVGDTIDASDTRDTSDATDTNTADSDATTQDQSDTQEQDTPALPPYGIPPEDADGSDPSEDAPAPDDSDATP